jgi:hypothetical protein
MVICDEPGFVFIHVQKSAGTSIKGALAYYDLMRQGARVDSAKRAAWIAAKNLPESVLDLPTHATALQVQTCIGAERFDSLFSFAVVRNPWDRELSWYTYNLQLAAGPDHDKIKPYKDFNDYVRRYLDTHGTLLAPSPQSRHLNDRAGAQLVDRVLKYETLQEDFAAVVEALSLEGIELDHFNQSYHAPWTEAYTRETFDLVKPRAQADAEAYGYPDDASAYGIA